MYPQYQEYTIQDDNKVAQVISGEKSLADSGILDELNETCAKLGCEVDWSFVNAFPKVFMLRTWKGKQRKSSSSRRNLSKI